MTKRLAMIVDEKVCWGCNACEVACKQENNPPEGSRWIRVKTEGVQSVDGRLKLTFFPARCFQCPNPPCKEACPVQAITTGRDSS